jgi:hypothetical protein
MAQKSSVKGSKVGHPSQLAFMERVIRRAAVLLACLDPPQTPACELYPGRNTLLFGLYR